jgi:hypothetical protein
LPSNWLYVTIFIIFIKTIIVISKENMGKACIMDGRRGTGIGFWQEGKKEGDQ